ncbi:MAG: penicillin acylase family protein [Vicinamibacterales bacterium]|jgi:penicillin amidase|nr:penicillin acylase family protein [Vicinamibacterales bacterium]
MLILRRSFIRVAGVTLTACLAGCAAPAAPPQSLAELASTSLAQIDGELEIPGLREPVEIIRDEWGIPHIYAQNDDDLFFAQGYVMAQDRLWQMEMWRRWHEGRLAEVFGPDALDYDRRTRLMMFRGPFDTEEWTSYHPDAERLFTAHANGVNAYIEQNRDSLPVEFQLTGIVPDPWTAETVVLRWAALAVPSVRGHAINEIQLAMNVARYGAEEANRRVAPDPWDDLEVPEGLDVSIITQDILDAMRAGDGDPFVSGRLPPLEVVEPFRSLMPGVQTTQVSPGEIATEGSNNWVMSAGRSPTGAPILANDPHRRIEMPALRYFVHLVAPGWNVIGGGEPPFAGVDAGNNERMAWGFTFAGTDMVDVYVEEMHPEDPNLVRWQDDWEPLRVIEEEISVKGQAPEPVVLKFSRHGPVFYEDLENRRAYAVRSVVQEPGTAAYKGSFQLAQAGSCADFFDRAMHWLVPTHSLICGDVEGNIALQVTGLTPNRDGWNGRLPVPGTGEYEWRGFRSDLPREFNPERGYIATANNNVHPPGYEGRPVFYHSSRGVETSRIARLHEIFGSGEPLSVEDHMQIQHDAHSLAAARDIPAFQGWTSADPDLEWARGLVAEWDATLSRESPAAAIYVRWAAEVDARVRDPRTSLAADERRRLVEQGLTAALERLTSELGSDRTEWRHGRVHASQLPHMMASAFDLPTVERPGGFGAVNATGANFRRIIDLADLDRSVASNSPGQSAQPGSPYYGNLVENLGNGEYFPLLYTRDAVEEQAAHRLRLQPGSR